MVRIIAGVLLAPWLYVLVWTLPVLDQAVHKWVMPSAFVAYLVFLVLAAITHVVLESLNRTGIYSYCAVMFAVAALLDMILSVWILSGSISNYYSQTQVVENGAITMAGYWLEIRSCLKHGVISAGAMAIFWVVALWKPQYNKLGA